MHGSARCLPLLAATALAGLLAAPGCTRHDFRQRADKDVEGIITQKNVFPAWQVKNWNAYPNPDARFADNSNPDRPPYPPDDYAARLLSPNPQKPTKRSGVGRVDGTGYLAVLENWDAQNRAEDPDPAARGNLASASPAPEPSAPPQTAQVARPRPSTQWTGRPAIPAPTILEGERPAVRHAPPSDLPAALRPSPAAPAVVGPVQPAVAPRAKTGEPGEFGPWVAARPHIPGPVVVDRGTGPTITELRPPVVIVASGEVESNTNPVPAGAVVPAEVPPVVPAVPVGPVIPPPVGVVPAAPVAPAGPVTPVWAMQPEKQPEKQPDPKAKVDPKPEPLPLPIPVPPDPKVGIPPVGPAGGGAAGDPAADYLALESGQVGYLLKIEQAVELGVLNARELQDRREDLYLAALPVTLERFNFTTLAFFTEQAFYRSTGRELTNGGQLWNLNTTANVSKLFPTGALLTAKMANQVVFDLSNDKPTAAFSNLSLSLAQPFLRGGGRAVTLENLTQAERTLVYAMRSYMRFRRLFFVAIAAGPTTPLGYTNNPYGLQGLSANLGRGVGNNLTAPNVGYLPLLLQLAIVSNQRKNVAELERLLHLYQAYREGGQLAPLQVDLLEVQLLNSRGQLLGQATGAGGGGGSGIRGYLDALDNFKLQLGLPLTVPLELNDGPLRPIYQQLSRLEEISVQARALDAEAERFDPALPVGDFRARWRALLTAAPLVRGTPFARAIAARWDSWSPAKLSQDQLDARMSALRAERQKLLDVRVDRQVKGVPEPEAEVRRMAALNNEIDLGEFERAVRAYEAQPWLKKGLTFVPQRVAYSAVYGAFQLLVIEARNERQEIVRGLWPQLPPLPVEGGNILDATLDEAYTLGVQTALTHRLDLMNARAQVVDAWRQIAVIANSLQGVFNVQYDLNSGTPAGGNSPFAFSGARSSNQVTFNAQLPLVRRAERNNYRAALIAYQRQRRTLMAFEDNIANDVRSDMRDLRTFAQLYRIQQRVVELGYSQVDNAQLTQFAPLAAGVTLDAAAQAALTQQVLTTQQNLVTAQNTLFNLWVSYQTARMSLYLDLEQMPLDDRGVWTDEFFNRPDRQDRTDPRQPGERLHAPRPLPDDGPGKGP